MSTSRYFFLRGDRAWVGRGRQQFLVDYSYSSIPPPPRFKSCLLSTFIEGLQHANLFDYVIPRETEAKSLHDLSI